VRALQDDLWCFLFFIHVKNAIEYKVYRKGYREENKPKRIGLLKTGLSPLYLLSPFPLK
jgi:hypothetical protein